MSGADSFQVSVHEAQDARDAAVLSGAASGRKLRALNGRAGKEWMGNWRRYWKWCAENDVQPEGATRPASEILKCCECYDAQAKYRQNGFIRDCLNDGRTLDEARELQGRPICEGCDVVERESCKQHIRR